jgi:hypothetical protein
LEGCEGWWCITAERFAAETSYYTVSFGEAKNGAQIQNFPAFHTKKHRGLKIVCAKSKDSV